MGKGNTDYADRRKALETFFGSDKLIGSPMKRLGYDIGYNHHIFMHMNGLLNDGPYKTASIRETLSLDDMLSTGPKDKNGDDETPLDDESREYLQNMIKDLMQLNSQIKGRSTHEKAVFNPIFRDAKRLAEQPTQRMKLNDRLTKVSGRIYIGYWDIMKKAHHYV